MLRRGQKVSLEIVLRRQHYLQACLQGTLILYWGYYWREVYHAAPLIAAQLLFAYGFDMTWGFEVALTEFYPPQMFLAIFLIGLPGQYLLASRR